MQRGMGSFGGLLFRIRCESTKGAASFSVVYRFVARSGQVLDEGIYDANVLEQESSLLGK